MTEEIIIDGVNVVGCEYMLNNKIKGKQHCPVKAMPYAKETSCICRKSIDTPYNFCKHNPNCHYKQLKRLEQENKELKEEIQFHNKENSNLLAERNAAQIGYDEIREVRERYRSVLEKIRNLVKGHKVADEVRLKSILHYIDEVLK